MSEKKKPCVCAGCDFRDVVFSYLDDPSIEELCDNKEEQLYRKGEIINHEGEKITNFKYLKSGLVKLYRRTSNGEEQVITITRPFEFVSNMSIFSEEKYQYSVSALEDSVVCSISGARKRGHLHRCAHDGKGFVRPARDAGSRVSGHGES